MAADRLSDRGQPSALLEARGIVKRYGTLLANDHVELFLAPGDIHALLGENGAGKSTLVKIIYGLVEPDEGSLTWQGRPVFFRGPAQARAAGIAMVFQHFALFDALSVVENIALALPDEPLSTLTERLRALSLTYGLHVEPKQEVWRLSAGERQRIEIIRCLMQNPRLLILDEPTSVLSPREARDLFATLEQIREDGRSVLYISHKLEEIRALCRSATILRHGKVVARCDPSRESVASLARFMVGDDVRPLVAARQGGGAPYLKVSGLSLASEDPHGTRLSRVDLEVRAGEIVGIAGVAGNGQRELFEALSGEMPIEAGSIVIGKSEAGRLDIVERRKLGAVFIPEERLGHGTAPNFDLSENLLLTRHAAGPEIRRGLIDMIGLRRRLSVIRERFDVRAASADPPARALSGGNLQKYMVGRDLMEAPRLIVVAQPTWGVDAGASSFIRQQLIDLAASGAAVLVISQDLEELYEICDRIGVLSRGRLSEALPLAAQSRENIGLLMGEAARLDGHAHRS